MSDVLRRGGRSLGGETPAGAPGQTAGQAAGQIPPPAPPVQGPGPQAGAAPGGGRAGSKPPAPMQRRPSAQPAFKAEQWDLPDHERLVSLWAPSSPQGKRIDILRSQLLYPFHGEPPRTIMVTSAVPGEGKSILAANLAISFARGLQQFVMIMDCHLMEPRQHELLTVPRRPGLTDYLEGRADVPDIMHWTQVERLSMIPAGSPSNISSELLATDRMAELVDELRSRYKDRYIILDTPSVQAFDDPAVLARQVEAIIYVVQSGATDREMVLRALGRLPEEKVFGVVLNDRLSAVVDASQVAVPGEQAQED